LGAKWAQVQQIAGIWYYIYQKFKFPAVAPILIPEYLCVFNVSIMGPYIAEILWLEWKHHEYNNLRNAALRIQRTQNIGGDR